jgi:hypothetical protein
MIVMDYELAMAASHDEGNRSMRRAGRKRWNRDDYNAACEAMDRFYPEPHRKSDGLRALRAVTDGEVGRCVWCGAAVRVDEADDHVVYSCPGTEG